MSDIDHEYTDEVVCPWCGYKRTDSNELFYNDEHETDTECGDCGEPFHASRIVTVDFSTSKITKEVAG